jgi:hypothetical protein
VNYCIDTSALMDAWVRWYPKELFPTLWDKVDALVQDGRLISSEEVLHELERKEGDTLHKWAVERSGIFLPLDSRVQAGATRVMASHPRLVDGRTGKSFADPWVIATAQAGNCAVITGERPTGKLDRPKIPDVCRDLGIRCISFVELIRQEGWRF